MLQFIDFTFNELLTIDLSDVKQILTSESGNILIENIDGLIYETDQIIIVK